jgi:hypothetical protein
MDIADPVSLVDRLNSTALRQQIDQLDGQRRALAVLLRAAMARERAGARAPITRQRAGEEVHHGR